MRWRSDACVETMLVRRACGTVRAVDSEWPTDWFSPSSSSSSSSVQSSSTRVPGHSFYLLLKCWTWHPNNNIFLSRSWLWMRPLNKNVCLSLSSKSWCSCSEATKSVSAPNVAKASSARKKKWEMECAMNLLTGHRSFTAICRHKTFALHTTSLREVVCMNSILKSTSLGVVLFAVSYFLCFSLWGVLCFYVFLRYVFTFLVSSWYVVLLR